MPGWIEIAVVLIILILLFGRGKISDLMSDVAKGITSFKKGLKEGDKTLEVPDQNEGAEALMDAEKSTKEKTDA